MPTDSGDARVVFMAVNHWQGAGIGLCSNFHAACPGLVTQGLLCSPPFLTHHMHTLKHVSKRKLLLFPDPTSTSGCRSFLIKLMASGETVCHTCWLWGDMKTAKLQRAVNCRRRDVGKRPWQLHASFEKSGGSPQSRPSASCGWIHKIRFALHVGPRPLAILYSSDPYGKSPESITCHCVQD